MFLRYETSLRDPLYDYIPCTRLELTIIDTKTFQRLKRINQTTGARFVYPGAEHSRFSHSLGVMHLAGKMAERLLVSDKLEKGFCATEKLQEICKKGIEGFPEVKTLSDDMCEIARKIEVVRLAGLLHDLGHCGFSHTLEPILKQYQKVDHEEMTLNILENSSNNEIKEAFDNSDEAKRLNIKVADIVELLKKETKEDKYLCEIISGTIDVDKIDYISRDAFHTGTIEYGAVDAERLTESLEIHGNSLIPNSSAVETVIAFWQARFHMFSAVYYHRVARAMEIIIRNMVDQFIRQYQKMEDKEKPKTVLSNFAKISSIDDYLLLDDFSVVSEFSRLRRDGYRFDLAFKFFDMYLKRQPLTVVDEYRPGQVDDATWKMLTDHNKLEAMEEEIAKLSGVPKDFIFVDAPPEVCIKVNPVFGKSLRDIVVYHKKTGKIGPIEEFDKETVEALSTLRGIIRIYTLDEYSSQVSKGYEEYKKNM